MFPCLIVVIFANNQSQSYKNKCCNRLIANIKFSYFFMIGSLYKYKLGHSLVYVINLD